MSSQVQLERTPLAHLLFALLVRRFDGVMTVKQPEPFGGERHVWFAGGMPYATDWVSQADVLGEVLIARGWVQPDVVDKALLEMSKTRALMGQWMVANGHLTQAQVIEALRIQCERKLQRMFVLREGTVSLAATEPAGGTLPQISTLRLIALGVLAHYDATHALAQLGAFARGSVKAGASFVRYRPQFGLQADDDAIVERLVAGVDLPSLAAAPDTHARLIKLALVLSACQMLETAEKAQTAPVSAAQAARAPAPSAAAATPAASAAAGQAQVPSPGQQAPARPSSPPTGPKGVPSSPTRPEPQAGVKSYPVSASHVAATSASSTPAAEFSAEAQAFETALVAVEAQLDTRTHAFDLFGVPLDADRKMIREAWARLSKEYHPDSLAGRGLTAFADRVTRVFAALSEASAELSDPERREALKEAIRSGRAATGESTSDVLRKSLEADRIGKDADRMMRAGAFSQAHDLFAQAHELSPDEPEYVAGQAWCAFQVAGRSPDAAKAARAVLAPLVAENPKSARAHYLLGMVLIACGLDGMAIGSLQEAMKLDPRMVDAERQLRAIRLRLSPPKTAPTGIEADVKSAAAGIFKGLFGGKK